MLVFRVVALIYYSVASTRMHESVVTDRVLKADGRSPTHHYSLPLGLGVLLHFFSCGVFGMYIVCGEAEVIQK